MILKIVYDLKSKLGHQNLISEEQRHSKNWQDLPEIWAHSVLAMCLEEPLEPRVLMKLG